jgi:hypothetical protein
LGDCFGDGDGVSSGEGESVGLGDGTLTWASCSEEGGDSFRLTSYDGIRENTR